MIRYMEVTEADFAKQAAQTFTAERLGAGVMLLAGPCPRCAAVITVPIFDKVYRGRDPVKEARQETVMCTCEEEHADRPESRVGCGAFWVFEIREEAS